MPVFTIDGVATHVHRHGEGPPLLYLHGAAESAEYAAPLTSLLERRFDVIQPERRGHGRTPDVAGPLGYDAMAADTIELLETLGLGPVPLIGYSDGAIVGLLVALARPDLLTHLVAIGPNARVDGLTAETLAWLREATAESWPLAVRRAYARLSPDGPAHWPVVAEKLRLLLLREPNLTDRQLATIAVPTLLVGGDRDAIRLEHLVELYRAIPGSQLSILPGAPHELPVAEPERVAELATRFIGAG